LSSFEEHQHPNNQRVGASRILPWRIISMKTYSKLSQSVLAATMILLLACVQAFAGHGGGEGGFIGGRGGVERQEAGRREEDRREAGQREAERQEADHREAGRQEADERQTIRQETDRIDKELQRTDPDYGTGSMTVTSPAGHTPSFTVSLSNSKPPRIDRAPITRSDTAPHSGRDDRSNAGSRAYHASNADRSQHPDWYHGNWQDRDNQCWHRCPAAWLAARLWADGFIAGAKLADFASLWSWGYLSYDNPYCTGPIDADDATIDYSQPIAVAAAPTTVPATQQGNVEAQWPVSTPMEPADEAAQALDAARSAFTKGDYAAALTQCDKAIAKTPNNTMLHEFRGLALFAQHRYAEAAASLYAVLSAGPGWDWTTMSSPYPDANAYTGQLRALEKYVTASPNSADARFVLAYHYLVCGHTDTAAAQFKAIVQLNPKDQLSAQILNALNGTDTSKRMEASTLVGNWRATRADGNTIVLNLSNDGKYTWTFAQKDKPQAFSGDYSVADNFLVLKQAGTPVMVGRVTPMAAGQFNFKLPGNNRDDPGLTFGK
jgi:tetratricopeptide (TPR) repeat protein